MPAQGLFKKKPVEEVPSKRTGAHPHLQTGGLYTAEGKFFQS
jgi:hypothetical protein